MLTRQARCNTQTSVAGKSTQQKHKASKVDAGLRLAFPLDNRHPTTCSVTEASQSHAKKSFVTLVVISVLLRRVQRHPTRRTPADSVSEIITNSGPCTVLPPTSLRPFIKQTMALRQSVRQLGLMLQANAQSQHSAALAGAARHMATSTVNGIPVEVGGSWDSKLLCTYYTLGFISASLLASSLNPRVLAVITTQAPTVTG